MYKTRITKLIKIILKEGDKKAKGVNLIELHSMHARKLTIKSIYTSKIMK
jgi:hypothetical protein